MRKTPRTEIRKEKRLVIYAAEGHNKTERNYVDSMKSEFRNISFIMSHDSSTDPIGMVRGLLKEMRCQGFSLDKGDRAFCFIDSDCNREKDRQIAEAEAIARKHGIVLIVSNPCIELWYLCHFRKSLGIYQKNKDVMDDLRTVISDYEKSDEGMYQKLKDRLEGAKEVARRCEMECTGKGYRIHTADFSPSTEAYKFIEAVEDMAGKY